MIELDSLSVEGKRKLITAACIIGLILSNVTFALRIWAKKSTIGVLHPEDWFMLAAVLLSYSFVACEFCGISVGLGEHEANVTKADLRQLNLSIWIIQRFQPPAIFCIKTSIILLYVRIFQTAKFKRVAWGIWIYTLLWTIGAWLASTFECTPVAFFWDKTIKGGHCVNNALTTVGFTDGFLSFLGDLFTLCMPLPMVWKLHMNTRGKLALSGIFLFGLFVVGTSIIRLIALFGIDTKDVSFTQVQGGIWTYLEVSIGITCGNLLLLRPLFRRFFDATSSAASKSNSRSNLKASDYARGLGSKVVPPGSTFTSRGFERMENDMESLGGSNGSELELQDRRYKGDGIKVDREVELRIDSVDAEDGHGDIGGGNGRRRDNGMRTDVKAL